MTKKKTARARADQRARTRPAAAPVVRPNRRRWWIALIGIVVLAAVGLGVGLGVGRSQRSSNGAHSATTAPLPVEPLASLGPLVSPGSGGPLGPEGVPIPAGSVLAPPVTTGQPIDGIGCSTGEQVAFHIHAHLTVFVNGIAKEVPAAVGIANPRVQTTAQGPFIAAGSCFYWLHTHAADGILHIESPVKATYNLGQFFDIWGAALGSDRVGPATGVLTAFYNGKHWTGSPRNIPLTAHAQIQLDVGSPLVAPESITFPSRL